MGVGASGAMVDVSSYAKLDVGVSRSWGRSSEFDDIPPGTFSFTLDNSDGRFTPGNTASALTTTVTEGMSVCWQLGTRLVAGTIRAIQPAFPGGVAAWAEVRITCDDMLGEAGRTDFNTSLANSMVLGSPAYLYWPFNEPVGSLQAVEQSGNHQLPFSIVVNDSPVFGVSTPTITALGDATQLQMPGITGLSQYGTGNSLSPLGQFTTINYATGSMGAWGAWFTVVSGTPQPRVWVALNGMSVSLLSFGVNPSNKWSLQMGSAFVASTATFTLGVPQYISVVITNSGSSSITGELFVDGVSQGTAVWASYVPDSNGLASNYLRTPWYVYIYEISGTTGAYNIAHLSHTATRVDEYLNPITESIALTALDQTVAGLTLDTLPSDLSTAPIAVEATSASILSAINSVIRTEQGAIYTTTTGTLTAPVQKVVVRARTRPTTVTASFDADRECAGSPDFVRDITDMASTVTAAGPDTQTSYFDLALVARVGSANVTESILNTASVDQLGFAQDRSQRGANTQLKLVTVTVDAMNTPTDRSADLLALIPGNRYQFTNLATSQLGFTTWDGWLLGVDENHDLSSHTFEMHFQPVLPLTAIYDTNRYMADGSITVFADINSAVTSVQLVTFPSTGPLMETSDVPYSLLLDSEQVSVTACTAPTTTVVTNIITNSVFHDTTTGCTAIPGTTGVTLLTGTGSLDPAYSGTVAFVQWTTASTAAGGGIYYEQAVSASTVYSFGVYHVLSSINNRLNIIIDWYNGGAFLSSSTGTQTQVTANTSYTSFTLSNVTSPGTATIARIKIISVAGTGYANWSINSSLEVSKLMCNTGATVATYFDGSTTDTPGLAYAWTGPAYASTSTFTTAYQTATITRAQASTVAAAHTTTSTVEVTPSSLYAF